MKPAIRILLLLGMLLALVATSGARTSVGTLGSDTRVPFVENAGQWDTPARFIARRGALSVRVEPDGLWLQQVARSGEDLVGHLIHVGFDAASRDVRLRGRERSAGTHSFFFGKEAEGRWRAAVPAYGWVEYGELYEGVDLSVSMSRRGIELGFRAEDEAALARVRLAFGGAGGLDLSEEGRVVLESSQQEGIRIQLVAEVGVDRGAGRLVRRSEDLGSRYGVSLLVGAGRSLAASLENEVVPPGLEWSSYLGAEQGDRIQDVVVDEDGVITVCGQTGSPAFPTTPGPFTQYGGWTWDTFVTRIDPDVPELVFSALLGGVFDDQARGLELADDGSVFVCGFTESANFPSTDSSYQTDLLGSQDAFVLHMGGTGTELLYSTYFGGSAASTYAVGITIDPTGCAAIVGVLSGPGVIPTTPGAFLPTPEDSFVTRFDPEGSQLVYSTYLGGGGGADILEDIASFEDGRVIVCGTSGSFSYPTTPGAYSEVNTSLPGPNADEMIVTILSADGSALEASTYVGGLLNDRARAVAVGPAGDIFIAGKVGDGFSATPGAFQETAVGGNDAAVIRLTPALDALVYSTRLGGNQFDFETGWGIAVDASGIATVAGTTNAFDFPVTAGALSEVNPGVEASEEAFVARVSPTGDRLFYSTYLGGGDLELEPRVAFDSHGSVVVAGYTDSLDFPLTPDALFGPPGGGINDVSDGYIARLSMLPTGVRKIGTSAESCLGEVFMGVTKMAQNGDPTFGVTCSGAPPSSGALLSLGFGEFPGGGLVLPEFTYYIDVFKPIVVFPDTSDLAGYAEFDLPLPPGTAGLEFFMQYIWVNTAACGGLGTLSASNALGITVQ